MLSRVVFSKPFFEEEESIFGSWRYAKKKKTNDRSAIRNLFSDGQHMF